LKQQTWSHKAGRLPESVLLKQLARSLTLAFTYD
jgi:hypothetical protein